MVKLMLYAGNDDNTDQDVVGVETPSAMKTNAKPVTQELQNTSYTKPECLADFKIILV